MQISRFSSYSVESILMSARVVFLLGAIGLLPIALSYGVSPEKTLPFLLGFSVEGVNHTHVFRAVMGLYLANATFWLVASQHPNLTVPALWVMLLFMGGLTARRLLSIVIDGVHNGVLLFYLAAEIGFLRWHGRR